MLLYGTDQGYANVFYLNNEKLMSSFSLQNNQADTLLLEKDNSSSKSFLPWGTLWKRKAHSDWVSKITYIPLLKAVISCSLDPNESLVVACIEDHKWIYHVSPIHKGAACHAFCISPITLITAGADRKIRLWNPHRLHHPMVSLKGHQTAVSKVIVNQFHGQLISLSIDKIIKIWDLRLHTCLQTFNNDTTQRSENIFSAILFNPIGRGVIVVGSSSLSSFKFVSNVASKEFPKSHDVPIRGLLYSPVYNQIVSGSDDGVINIWVIIS